METRTRTADLFRAVIVTDHDKNLPEVASDYDPDEGEAILRAANAKAKHPERTVILQRSFNGADGPWVRY